MNLYDPCPGRADSDLVDFGAWSRWYGDDLHATLGWCHAFVRELWCAAAR